MIPEGESVVAEEAWEHVEGGESVGAGEAWEHVEGEEAEEA